MQAVLKQWLVAASCALFAALSFPAVAADTSSAQEQAARQQVQPGTTHRCGGMYAEETMRARPPRCAESRLRC